MTGLLLTALSFLAGSVPFGLLLGRLLGVDVRRHGSGNIGATNVGRSAGRVAGALTLLLDAGKGAFGPGLALATGAGPAWAAACGAAAIAGHCWTPWLGGRGGKGVATLIGAFVALDAAAAAAGGLAFAATLAWTRIVALASLALSLVLLLAVAARHGLGDPRALLAMGGVGLVLLRHRANWQRLRRGEEPRVFARRARG